MKKSSDTPNCYEAYLQQIVKLLNVTEFVAGKSAS